MKSYTEIKITDLVVGMKARVTLKALQPLAPMVFEGEISRVTADEISLMMCGDNDPVIIVITGIDKLEKVEGDGEEENPPPPPKTDDTDDEGRCDEDEEEEPAGRKPMPKWMKVLLALMAITLLLMIIWSIRPKSQKATPTTPAVPAVVAPVQAPKPAVVPDPRPDPLTGERPAPAIVPVPTPATAAPTIKVDARKWVEDCVQMGGSPEGCDKRLLWLQGK